MDISHLLSGLNQQAAEWSKATLSTEHAARLLENIAQAARLYKALLSSAARQLLSKLHPARNMYPHARLTYRG